MLSLLMTWRCNPHLTCCAPIDTELRSLSLQANHRMRSESETYDIYLLPPGEDPETCQSWLRMRNRDGRYNLMFEEWVTDGPFIISPRITFEVNATLSSTQLAAGAVAYSCKLFAAQQADLVRTKSN